MQWRFRCVLLFVLLPLFFSLHCNAQTQKAARSIDLQQYSVVLEPGIPPRLKVEREHKTVFEVPMIAGLASTTAEEHLSDIDYSLQKSNDDVYELKVSAKSTLWSKR